MEINAQEKIICWIKNDPWRMQILETAASLDLPDWCIAAGFVRNLIWDQLHGYNRPTPLNDIDVIYFDPTNTSESREKELESTLNKFLPAQWSVKNQSRFHIKNIDLPYRSTADAMTYWVEVETAVGVYIDHNQQLRLLAPFGITSLHKPTLSINLKRPKPLEFDKRIKSKNWLELWPQLEIRKG